MFMLKVEAQFAQGNVQVRDESGQLYQSDRHFPRLQPSAEELDNPTFDPVQAAAAATARLAMMVTRWARYSALA